MTEAMGPMWAGGTQSITKSGYTLVYVADVNNSQLQAEGKPAVYYWLPNQVRLARKDGDSGDYKFSFLHFVGDDAEANEGRKTGGGLLAFSTTSAPPAAVLQETQDEILSRFRGSSEHYWGWRNNIAPAFRPAPIVSNTMTITNLSPNTDGSLPTPAPADRNSGRPRTVRVSNRIPPYRSPRTFSLSKAGAARANNLDVWYANLQGQGQGSVLPTAENAFSGLVGSYPAALIWESFHSGSGGITVWQNLQIKVWSPVVRIKIEGEWERIQSHFSAAASVNYFFWSADIKAEFNNLVADGAIKVTTQVDQTIPGADKIAEQLNKTKDLVFTKFMDAAQKTIFDPAPFTEEPAEASGGFFGFGGGASFKLRRDTVRLKLEYEEENQFAYLQSFPISGQMEGLYDEIQADPEAEKRYFRTIYLGDWEQDVSRTIKPIVNYPDPEREWVGQPVAFLSAQIGYPNVDGTIAWDGHLFQSSDPADQVWNWKKSKKRMSDVTNAPNGWQPDQTFIKRQVHLSEPPSDFEYPYARIQIEKNVIDLDPGVNGTMLNDINLEVRTDSVGTLSAGPISLGRTLTEASQNVEVTLQALGKDENGNDHAPVKLLWKFEDQEHERFWMIFTGQLNFVPRYQYKVRVIVKGSLFTDGMEWEHKDWQQSSGSGPLIVSVPKPDSANVVTRSLPSVTGVSPASTASTLAGAPVSGLPGAPGKPPGARRTGTPGMPGRPPGTSNSGRQTAKTPMSVRGYSLEAPVGTNGRQRSAESDPAAQDGDLEIDYIVPSFD
jgi:hypothetical protein